MRARLSLVQLVSVVLVLAGAAAPVSAQGRKYGPLAGRAANLQSGFSPVIIETEDAATSEDVKSLIQQHGGSPGRALSIIHAHAAVLPNAAIKALSDNPGVKRVSFDRATSAAMDRTSATVGATAMRQAGYDGHGVGVAIIDSGVTTWHDDLSSAAGGQRVTNFVDFVNGRSQAYDDYGHGTHVAGIVAGNGYDSAGARSGIAPGSSLVVLKTLDKNGAGRISQVIAAFDYVLAHRTEFNIRVVNVSISTGVYESYTSDPLAKAAKRLVDAGIVVVAAAGNGGVDPQGRATYGSITAPGNAPWVLTVGASSHMGTVDRSDDTMAGFSSRGPAAVDIVAKPDIVAPGVGIESLSDPASAFYTSKAQYLLDGTTSTPYHPYLSLSGTSMSAPVVAGTVALMMQANPALTPNAVKGILQYTAQVYSQYNRLTQGAGFLNAKGAVELAAFLGGSASAPSDDQWSHELIWGNHLVRGGTLTPHASAWSTAVSWGDSLLPDGRPVEWGVTSGSSGHAWAVPCDDAACTTLTWRGSTRNVVWGDACGGDDCAQTWTLEGAGAALATASENEIVVWGSVDYEDNQIVVWGSANDEDNLIVVWGSSGEFDIVVWGSDCTACESVVWSR